MVSLSSEPLQSLSSAYLLTPDSGSTSASLNNGLTPLSETLQSGSKSPASTASSSAAQLADDIYTPSSQSGQSASSGSATASSSSTSSGGYHIPGLSAAQVSSLEAAEASGNWDQRSTAQYALYNAIESGNLSAAQTANTQYQQALENPLYQLSSLTTPSQQLLDGVSSLGKALASGDLASAASIYQNDVRYADYSGDNAESTAYGALKLDGASTAGVVVTADENKRSSSLANDPAYVADTNKIATDFQNYDGVLEQGATLLSNYLVSQGFSSKEADLYSQSTFQVALPSVSQSADSSLGKVQAAEYVQDINQFAQNYVATKSTSPLDDGPWQTTVNAPATIRTTSQLSLRPITGNSACNATHRPAWPRIIQPKRAIASGATCPRDRQPTAATLRSPTIASRLAPILLLEQKEQAPDRRSFRGEGRHRSWRGVILASPRFRRG